MKKVFFVLTFILGVCCTAQAGYVIRGIYTNSPPYYSDLKNYTLTFTPDDVPVSAASMHTTYTSGTGKNTIVIIREDNQWAHLFPMSLSYDPNSLNNVEVRDFHYDRENDVYVLCGSRQLGSTVHAFVATIDHNFQMRFMEYPETDMFHSIGDPNITTPSTLMNNYYLCGTSGAIGIIVSVDRASLFLTNHYRTNIDWEYHKIIVKQNPDAGTPAMPHFIASGRNPECSSIGFTTLNASLTPINSYMWNQATEPRSHCVVSDDVSTNNAVILASSYYSAVTLNPVTYPIPSSTVRAYRYALPSNTRYFVQDIGMIRINAATSRFSVVGFKIDPSIIPAHAIAWHGYVQPSSFTVPMTNNDYYDGIGSNFYEHYKIRHSLGNDYTGGNYRSGSEMGALFATPLTPTLDCGDIYPSYPNSGAIPWSSFTLDQHHLSLTSPIICPLYMEIMELYDDCPPFKGEEPALKSVISAEDESEIATSYDRITLKDVPANTGYQIYNTIGQLISTGVTTPDISTASLSKGVYILRLENGKTFKFVK